MPVEQVREQPLPLLLIRAVRWSDGDIPRQSSDQLLNTPLPFVDRLGRFAALDRRSFRATACRPAARIPWLRLVVRDHPAEQVFEPAIGDEWVAFEVKEHVARRGLRESRQASARLDRKEYFVDGVSRGSPLELDARLFPNTFVPLHSASFRSERQRNWGRSERLERPDTVSLELACLEFRYASNQTEMIIVPPTSVTERPPPADVTVLDGVWIRRRVALGVDRFLEPPFHESAVSAELVNSKGLGLERGSR